MPGEAHLTWGVGEGPSEAKIRRPWGRGIVTKSGEHGLGLQGPKQKGTSCAPGERSSGTGQGEVTCPGYTQSLNAGP